MLRPSPNHRTQQLPSDDDDDDDDDDDELMLSYFLSDCFFCAGSMYVYVLSHTVDREIHSIQSCANLECTHTDALFAALHISIGTATCEAAGRVHARLPARVRPSRALIHVTTRLAVWTQCITIGTRAPITSVRVYAGEFA